MHVARAAALAASILVAAQSASAQTSISGFGALPVNQLSVLGDSSMPVDFGGRIGFEVAPGIHLVGEFGRIGNVIPDFDFASLAFSSLVPVKLSAFYGEGGVRLLAAPRSAVSPYVEGTAGVAHLRFDVDGLGALGTAIARPALSLVGSRDPLVGGGGGLLLHGGPLQLDLGYRYKRILARSTLSTVFSLGQDLETHQVRFGVGVRF